MDRVKTGIEGLDQLLCGGFLRGDATLVAGAPGMLAALEAAAREVPDEGVRESGEHDLTIRVEAVSSGDALRALGVQDTERLVTVLMAVPHGVLGMHPTVEGLVETSNNVATIGTQTIDDGRVMRVVVGMLSRSSSDSRMREALSQLATLGRLGGAAVETANEYPGWEPNIDSPTLATCHPIRINSSWICSSGRMMLTGWMSGPAGRS